MVKAVTMHSRSQDEYTLELPYLAENVLVGHGLPILPAQPVLVPILEVHIHLVHVPFSQNQTACVGTMASSGAA